MMAYIEHYIDAIGDAKDQETAEELATALRWGPERVTSV